jgi:uncharacterized repeat protein (TIGR01451 family)
MLARKLFTVAAVQILCFAAFAHAQGVLSGNKSIGERLDDFNRAIFGNLFSDNKDAQDSKDNAQNNKQAPRPMPGKYDSSKLQGDGSAFGNGAAQKPFGAYPQRAPDDSPAKAVRVYRNDGIIASSGGSVPDSRPGGRYFENIKGQDGAEMPENSPPTASPVAAQSSKAAQDKDFDRSATASQESDPAGLPLHQRFQQFRRSAFDSASKTETLDNPARSGIASSLANTEKSSNRLAAEGLSSSVVGSVELNSPRPGLTDPLATGSDLPEPAATRPAPKAGSGRPTLAKRPPGMRSSDYSAVGERSSPALSTDDSVIAEGSPVGKAKAAKPSSNPFQKTDPSPGNETGVLFARKGPALSVETHGPRKIAVGKESVYEVKIINSGDVAAEDLIVMVNLPDWAEVIGSEASIGSAQARAPGAVHTPLQWNAGHLEAKSQAKLSLRIVPRQSRPFDLAVNWQYKPVSSQTMIEVQEPRLEMQLEGPHEVLYGKKETYQLKLLNTGTGDAEGVSVKFMPVGAGENVPAVYPLGILPAGEDREIEVELTARQSGMLEIQIEAKADTGVHAELAEKVLVRRAALDIALDGPKLQFVGTAATYSLRVRNSGNSPAKNIKFTAVLPAGMKYIGGIEGARVEKSNNKLRWTAESISPEAVQSFTIKCLPSAAGVNRMEVSAAAEEDLNASAVAVTQVESVANLVLDVKDPGGPVAVGEEAVYEIRVRNRGTKDAEGVEVIGYFSRGIEPISAEGGAARIAPGEVVFSPIPSLAAGAEVVLKITARAEAPGNHIFRAEMHCKALGSRLVSEDATLYYQDALSIPQNLQARPQSDRSMR